MKNGFTLIELMIVVAIVIILFIIVMSHAGLLPCKAVWGFAFGR